MTRGFGRRWRDCKELALHFPSHQEGSMTSCDEFFLLELFEPFELGIEFCLVIMFSFGAFGLCYKPYVHPPRIKRKRRKRLSA